MVGALHGKTGVFPFRIVDEQLVFVKGQKVTFPKLSQIWGSAGGFELGVFGVVGVGEARACAGIVGGRLDAGLGTGGGPPAGSVLFQFAHFDAAGAGVGFGAVAIALAGGNRAK